MFLPLLTLATLIPVASGGFYSSPWGTKHPKIQLLTVAELLAGKGVDRPPTAHADATFKRAPRAAKKEAQNMALPLGGADEDG